MAKEFSLKLDIQSLLESIRRKKKTVIKEVEKGMFMGMRLFEGFILRTQLSGRVTEDDFGLNRISGALARSGFVEADRAGGRFSVRLGYASRYAATHQFGDRRLAWGRVMVTYPKRLHIPEAFIGEMAVDMSGFDMMREAVAKRIGDRFLKHRIVRHLRAGGTL